MRRSFMSFGLAALVVLIWPATALAATNPGLGTAGNFAVLSGTPNITNTGPSWITGQVGIDPGCAVTGFPPGTSGVQHKCDAVALQAKSDLTSAYTRAMNAPCPGTNNLSGVNLGGKTLVPGVYCQTTAPTLTGTLTLNGSGIYIFQIGSTLITATGARISLIGGAQAVPSAQAQLAAGPAGGAASGAGGAFLRASLEYGYFVTLGGLIVAMAGGWLALAGQRPPDREPE